MGLAHQPVTTHVVVGEQVDGRAARSWLDAVSADLEHAGYAFGAAVLPSASVGAPHARHRTFWVANRGGPGLPERIRDDGVRSGPVGALTGEAAFGGNVPERLADLQGDRLDRRAAQPSEGARLKSQRLSASGVVDHPGSVGRDQGRNDHARHVGQFVDSAGQSGRPGAGHDGWASVDWIGCRDGRWRPVEPGTQPLAYGVPGRVGLLRGYGNAIVPQVGAAFMRAVMEALDMIRKATADE